VEIIVAEPVSSEGPANCKVGSTTAISPAVVTVLLAASAHITDDDVHVEDKLSRQIVALIVAEVRGFRVVVAKRPQDKLLVTVPNASCT
jgi:hypothetical protein